MLHKILIPLDGSDLAERALAPAFALAQHAEGSVVLVRAAEPETMLVTDTYSIPGKYGAGWPNQPLAIARQQAAHYLNIVRNTKAPARLRVQVQIAAGDPAEVIVDIARIQKVDLIAVSSHGYSGFTRWMLGSVAERVLGAAHCPVLVIRSDRPLHHILIPLDGSPLSEQIVAPAFEIAEALGSKVTLLRSVRLPSRADIEEMNTVESGSGEAKRKDLQERAEAYLQGIAATHRQETLETRTVVLHDSPANCILEYAQRYSVDLIAMSTHGWTGPKRWVYGSVTEKVLHGTSHCSMLLTRPGHSLN